LTWTPAKAIVHEECLVHAEGAFDLDPSDHDVEKILRRLGAAYIEFLCSPEKASALRTVIAIADRMPEIGKVFYETGPSQGIAKLADYLRAETQAGVLAVDDAEVAAAQFLDACQSTLFKPVLFNFAEAPAPDPIKHVVGIAVKTFLAAYRARWLFGGRLSRAERGYNYNPLPDLLGNYTFPISFCW
jgi:hypothetical protein